MDKKGYLFINLMPYREAIRKEQIKQFSMLMGFFAIVAGFMVFMAYSAVSLRIDAQNSRNSFIKKANKALDAKIKDISGLRDEIKTTLNKRKVVEDLQANRSDAVNILNEVANRLPDGMTLTEIKQSGDLVMISGTATSNNKVSNYMEALASTDVFENPTLTEVKAIKISSNKKMATVGDDQNLSEFTIMVGLKRSSVVEKNPNGTSAKVDAAKVNERRMEKK